MRTYVIGDIHGQLGKLRRAHVLIEADRAEQDDDNAPVVHIGDLVDRGPDSRGVIDFLIGGLADGEPWVVLKGNHDRMMSLYLRETCERDPRLRPGLDWAHEILGGLETMASYGVDISAGRDGEAMHRDARAAVPRSHVGFLDGLPAFYRRGDAYFCHAGIRPGIPLEHQVEDDLVWIRREFLDDGRDHGPLIVHGHTPVDAVTHCGNRLNVDTGAGYGRALSAVVIEGRKAWLLTDAGRVEITPL